MRVTLLLGEKDEGEEEDSGSAGTRGSKCEATFTLFINEVKFNELEDAPPEREREPLARSTTSINMNGHKK